MVKKCCKNNDRLSNQSSNLLLDVIASRTNFKNSECSKKCSLNKKCCGKNSPLEKKNIYRNKQIATNLKTRCCDSNSKLSKKSFIVKNNCKLNLTLESSDEELSNIINKLGGFEVATAADGFTSYTERSFGNQRLFRAYPGSREESEGLRFGGGATYRSVFITLAAIKGSIIDNPTEPTENSFAIKMERSAREEEERSTFIELGINLPKDNNIIKKILDTKIPCNVTLSLNFEKGAPTSDRRTKQLKGFGNGLISFDNGPFEEFSNFEYFTSSLTNDD